MSGYTLTNITPPAVVGNPIDFISITPDSSHIIVRGGGQTANNIYRSSNLGNTWTEYTLGPTVFNFVSDVDSTGQYLLYISTELTKLYLYNFNTGESTLIKDTTGSRTLIYNVRFGPTENISTGGYIYTFLNVPNTIYVEYSNDLGSTWTQNNTAFPSENFPFLLSSITNGYVFVFTEVNFFISTDYGANFISQEYNFEKNEKQV